MALTGKARSCTLVITRHLHPIRADLQHPRGRTPCYCDSSLIHRLSIYLILTGDETKQKLRQRQLWTSIYAYVQRSVTLLKDTDY